MQAFINSAYSDTQRLAFAEEIITRALPHQDGDAAWHAGIKETFKYWGVFIPFPPRSMQEEESEIEYVATLYDQLRMYAVEWMFDYRIQELNREFIATRDAIRTLTKVTDTIVGDMTKRIESLEETRPNILK